LPKGFENVPVATKSNTADILSQAHLKIAALEMLLENTSKEPKVDIVKKVGSKQSVK
jgi:hypothetical protein